MAIDNQAVRFLISCKDSGANFERVITLGRQNFWGSHPFAVGICNELGVAAPNPEIFSQEYSDEFLKWLGASVVHSVDASEYEGATLVHDMNRPVEAALHQRYTLLFDGGTLEHIFNFPQAIENCMNLLAPGGEYIAATPTNNFAGHGFYQFTPELYYRIFSAENGFVTRRMVLTEVNRNEWLEVRDPEVVQSRVEFTSSRPCYLLIWARKLEHKSVFQTTPTQSDYARIWNNAEALKPQNSTIWAPRSWRDLARKLTPAWVLERYERLTKPRCRPGSAFVPTGTRFKPI